MAGLTLATERTPLTDTYTPENLWTLEEDTRKNSWSPEEDRRMREEAQKRAKEQIQREERAGSVLIGRVAAKEANLLRLKTSLVVILGLTGVALTAFSGMTKCANISIPILMAYGGLILAVSVSLHCCCCRCGIDYAHDGLAAKIFAGVIAVAAVAGAFYGTVMLFTLLNPYECKRA